MQYVNDDMDELFRRAAENYPLDTSSADWNKVLAALQGEAQEKTVSENKRNKNGRLLWLLLLLPLGLVCNQLYSPGIFRGKEVSKTNDANENVALDKSASQKNTSSSNPTQNNNDNAVAADKTKIGTEKSIENGSKNSFDPGMKNSATPYSSGLFYPKTKAKNDFTNKVTHTNIQTNNETSVDLFAIEDDLHSRNYVSEVLFSRLWQNDVSTSVTKKIDPLFSSSEENSKQPIRVARRKRFYAGVIGGVDGTTIKFQKIENAGATYGLLFGYQLNKKWSIETGAFVEKKYYYTEGKYFNTSKLPIPPSWQIDNVSGNCKMIEVPVSLKYNFSAHKNSNWFATAGSSSYFMKKQDYTYDYYYGSWGPYTRRIPYDTSSSYFFSNISLSVGYSHRVGNVGNLRIEPYVKLPVSGVGIGTMPLLSAGLQIGITRKF